MREVPGGRGWARPSAGRHCLSWLGSGAGVGRLSVAEGISGPTERPGRRAWWACGVGAHGRDSSVLSKERPGWQRPGAAALDLG